MLDLGRLRVLRTVAEHGSMSAAAARLSYTPSAVSQKIAALERDVGIGLVERGAHGTSLTDAGRTLVRHAEEILGRLADAEQELQELVGLRAGRLRLGVFSPAAAVVLPLALANFRREHPAVDVSVVELAPEVTAEQLHARELDLGLVYEFPAALARGFDGLELYDLLDDPPYVALSMKHRLAGRDRVTLAELAGEAWIGDGECGSAPSVLAASCRANGFEPRIVLRTDDHMAVQGCVAAGLGIALVPRLAVPIVRRDVALCPLEDDVLWRRVGLALPPGASPPAGVRAMMAVLTESCRRLAGELDAHDAARRPQPLKSGSGALVPCR